jgi:large subunit ribosomal protein L10
MQLADLESREVLLAKLAGAMKGSLAKAARIFDALRIKMEAVSEPSTNSTKSEVPAQAVTTDVVSEAEAAPAAEAVAEVTEEVVAVSEPSSNDAVAEVPVQDANTSETPAE